MRVIVGIAVALALIGFGWVFSLPDKAECVASGRVVDPTERHCLEAGGYQQLQEHALFHSREVVLGAVLLLGSGFGIYRYIRRRRSPVVRPGAPSAP